MISDLGKARNSLSGYGSYFYLCFIILFLCLVPPVWSQETRTPLTHEQIQSVKLSPNGDSVLIRSRRALPDQNRYLDRVWIKGTGATGDAQKLNLPGRVQEIDWLKSGEAFAFLSSNRKGPQVFIHYVKDDSSRQLTRVEGMVRDFAISPGGDYLAYTVLKRTSPQRDTGNRSERTEPKGRKIDLLTYNAVQLRSQGSRQPRSGKSVLKIKEIDSSAKTRTVGKDKHVYNFRWSPGADRIALTTDRAPTTKRGLQARSRNLEVYHLERGTLHTLRHGTQKAGRVFEGTVSYRSPFWSPSGEKLGFLRFDYSDRWSSVPEVGVINLESGDFRYITDADSEDLYNPRFHWLRRDQIFVEGTHKAKRGLFSMDPGTGEIASLNSSLRRRSGFSFDAEGESAAWLEESMTDPPEVYFSRTLTDSGRSVTTLNRDILPNKQFSVRYLEWKSNDGTQVQGWYLHHGEKTPVKPPAVLTLVHGGPGIAVENRFYPYLEQWTYPVYQWVREGRSVFIPNYRGTPSFGKNFMEPEAPDREPVQDIHSGLDMLIARGLADSSRLVISGHSHGAWLGAMAAAEQPRFHAASFAEGLGNYLSLYGRTAGFRNLDLHEYTLGTHPYRNTGRYLELSPAFLRSYTRNTPSLLEFGRRSPVASQGVELAKALWRQGTPQELVFYPGTGHVLRRPALQRDAARRNLQWFERWLEADDMDATQNRGRR